MEAYDRYFQVVQDLLNTIRTSERESIAAAGRLAADAIRSGGLIRIFGTGHSHIIGEDAFFRAGGLVPVLPISEPQLMLHEGPVASSALERMSGLAQVIFNKYRFSSNDTLVIVSNSGVNAVPVEMAKIAKQHGLKIIAIVSKAYCRATAERKGLKETLVDCADVVVDNHLPPGDALVEITDGWRMGPGSTIAGSLIIHQIMMAAAETLCKEGVEPPILISSNMPGAPEHNSNLLERYRDLFWQL